MSPHSYIEDRKVVVDPYDSVAEREMDQELFVEVVATKHKDCTVAPLRGLVSNRDWRQVEVALNYEGKDIDTCSIGMDA